MDYIYELLTYRCINGKSILTNALPKIINEPLDRKECSKSTVYLLGNDKLKTKRVTLNYIICKVLVRKEYYPSFDVLLEIAKRERVFANEYLIIFVHCIFKTFTTRENDFRAEYLDCSILMNN